MGGGAGEGLPVEGAPESGTPALKPQAPDGPPPGAREGAPVTGRRASMMGGKAPTGRRSRCAGAYPPPSCGSQGREPFDPGAGVPARRSCPPPPAPPAPAPAPPPASSCFPPGSGASVDGLPPPAPGRLAPGAATLALGGMSAVPGARLGPGGVCGS